ncbi:hypothetical protein J14TS2_29820 [Bacillus sp. J14TS2]|uniref:alpha-L-fucosidase n=1 Tax=Bacillus sp. J14TS2 TaxID=2807188 RepID=UPI001B2E9A98|nr:alpha-L-fucosidase [Bacillus sp. J14TS2]GIN72507.1 hypothetical protein J14TS2_29820 [Bacillus sp. J14TS2]
MLIKEQTKEIERVKWWKEAKFGMFIHWGLYATLAKGEWVMAASKIPVKEYEQFAAQFNPREFNAKEWVGTAKRAGMKYIVITAKHHDGFAMYQSQVEKFNIVDATPFERDPMKELAEECQRQGIKLCFYYSHVIDWHHPHSVHEYYNNTWDYKLEEKAFYNYWHNLARPQIKELLTQYGDIGLLWFDTAGGLSKKDSKELVEFVHQYQPNCLVNSRVSHWPNIGDYQSKGDNEIPMYGEDSGPWETPMTLNQSWGYSDKDQVWKTPESIIRKMVNIVSKGGNLLLNVGPSAEGVIPEKSVEVLEQAGAWIERNGEAIYGTNASPFSYELEWGAVTIKPRRMYLHVNNEKWTDHLKLFGLKNKVLRAYLLADQEKENLSITQSYTESLDHHILGINLPKGAPDQYISIIVLELAGNAQVDEQFMQQVSGSVNLDLVHAETAVEMNEKTAKWNFKITQPGTFNVVLVNFKKTNTVWEEHYNEEVKVEIAGQELKGIPQEDQLIKDSPACQYPYSEVHSVLGCIDIVETGNFPLTLTSNKIREKSIGTEIWQAEAVKLRSIKLVPISKQ